MHVYACISANLYAHAPCVHICVYTYMYVYVHACVYALYGSSSDKEDALHKDLCMPNKSHVQQAKWHRHYYYNNYCGGFLLRC